VNSNLFVARETIHERQGLVIGAIIDNLVNKGHWKVVLGTGVIDIAKVRIDVDSPIFC
jgi:hypothetical protein